MKKLHKTTKRNKATKRNNNKTKTKQQNDTGNKVK
jgi:hypothetical protein